MPGVDTVLTYCKGLLARVAASPPVAVKDGGVARGLTGASRVAEKASSPRISARIADENEKIKDISMGNAGSHDQRGLAE